VKSVVDLSVVLQRAFLLKFGTPLKGPVSFSFGYCAGVIDYSLDHVTCWHLDTDLNPLVLPCYVDFVVLLCWLLAFISNVVRASLAVIVKR
jgi:hypothetical protein